MVIPFDQRSLGSWVKWPSPRLGNLQSQNEMVFFHVETMVAIVMTSNQDDQELQGQPFKVIPSSKVWVIISQIQHDLNASNKLDSFAGIGKENKCSGYEAIQRACSQSLWLSSKTTIYATLCIWLWVSQNILLILTICLLFLNPLIYMNAQKTKCSILSLNQFSNS